MTKQLSAFEEFHEEQRLLNQFLWSSEVAHETVLQKFLTPAMLERTEPLRVLFEPPLECNAFVPPAGGKHPSKYEETPNVFREHIGRNLEANCKLVIIHFNRTFERFLRRRTKLKLSKGASQKMLGDLHGYLNRGGGENYLEYLGNLGIPASSNVPFEYFLDVCIYKQVRHDIAHADDDNSVNFGAKPWSDSEVVKKCEKNAAWHGKPVFPDSSNADQQTKAIKRVCINGARRNQFKSKSEANPEGEPLIFFYALFSLGAYRKLAVAINKSLPPARKSA